jgi:hypothetical protein
MAQEPGGAAAPGGVHVDSGGVLRWTETGAEVALFGVNYSVPFAHGFRAHGYLGVDRKTAMDADVLHMTRLGLDAYRVHVWDREISDGEGNLLENDHLDLLDYLIARLSERGIRVILTPIAWWGAGYPEPDPETDGLSDGWSKGEMTTEAEPRGHQVNYLRQFISHVNAYTGESYRDDPDILAVEIFNEPSHPRGPAETTGYIDAMVGALRSAGFQKPIFYNISQGYSDEHGRAVCAADIQGVTHQWYPTGLVRNAAVGGNMLPNVNRYTIPYADFAECTDKARMVYEFDAADVGGSYMYPAMARAFRGAGFQWATQFAYDPMAMAYANTDYQTHFLNLVYTPAKAISFMIAGEVFRAVPRGTDFGSYPGSEVFGPLGPVDDWARPHATGQRAAPVAGDTPAFRVSYEADVSEMVSARVFLHSGDTDTSPPDPSALERLAGVGSSPVVRYDGTGVWFLDRLDDGVWRLEVYPDVAWVVDPFSRPSLDRVASRVVWRTRKMRIELPDLGVDFSATALNDGNLHRAVVRGTQLAVRPGAYLLTRAGIDGSAWGPETRVGRVGLSEFIAPPSTGGSSVLLHEPVLETPAAAPLEVAAQVVTDQPVDSVVLLASPPGGGFRRPVRVRMARRAGFAWRGTLPADVVREGLLSYRILVWEGGDATTFPGAEPGVPWDWDFTGPAGWEIAAVHSEAPIVLFDARRDRARILYPSPWEYVPFQTDLVPGGTAGALVLRVVVETLEPTPHHFALRTFLPETERSRLGASHARAVLRIRARSPSREADRMELALVTRDGAAWGTTLELSSEWHEYNVALSTLERTPLVLLPRPYPQFLPYRLEAEVDAGQPELASLDGIQLAVGSELFTGADLEGAHGFEVEWVVLEMR